MTKVQILKTLALTAIILAVAMVLDYLMNAVVMPEAGAYTPLSTAAITLLVAPAAIAYLILQSDRVQRAQAALAEERVARLAADGANAAKTRFLANMSHELRTPLNAIIGFSEIIEEDAGDAALCADAQRIRRSARHLMGMIDEILDHIKLETGELRLTPERADLHALFGEVVGLVRPSAENNGNTLRAECDAEIGVAWIDAQRLKQCMLCLVSNAAKFTENGRIALRLGAVGTDEFSFEVSDTGIGISVEALANLFQPFMQADSSMTRAFDGAGVSLALTKQLIDAMGGVITVISAPGEGSTFSLRLPRGAAPANVVTLAA